VISDAILDTLWLQTLPVKSVTLTVRGLVTWGPGNAMQSARLVMESTTQRNSANVATHIATTLAQRSEHLSVTKLALPTTASASLITLVNCVTRTAERPDVQRRERISVSREAVWRAGAQLRTCIVRSVRTTARTAVTMHRSAANVSRRLHSTPPPACATG